MQKSDDFIRTINDPQISDSSEESEFEFTSDSFFNKLGNNNDQTDNQKKIRERLIKSTQSESDPLVTSLNDKIAKLTKKNKRKRDSDPIIYSKETPNINIQEDIESIETKKKKEEKKSEIITFHQLHLIKPLLKSCEDLSFHTPTMIQRMAIPAILSGKDL